MKRLLLITGWIISGLTVAAQQEYYIFIQETGGQPFYVRMDEKSHSSSPVGHIILPQLGDSTYQMYIGFPRDRYPEQLFRITISGKDRGFELKNMNGSWQLFDLQQLQLLQPVRTDGDSGGTALGPKRTDAYSRLMAGIVNDSAVLYNYTVKKEIEKKDTVKTQALAEANAMPADQVTVGIDPAGVAATIADSARVVVMDDTASHTAAAGQHHQSAEVQIKDTTAVVATIKPADKPIAMENSRTDSITTSIEVAERKDIKPVKEDSLVQQKASILATTPAALNIKEDSLLQQKTAPVAVVRKDPPQRPAESGAGIVRMLTENTAEGKLMIYIDRSGPLTDTIRLTIPRL